VVVPENEEIFSYSGDFEITEMIVANSSTEVQVSMPVKFALSAAYPNPFNPSTSISLHVPMVSNVSVQVYDLSGRMISTLLSGVQAQGDYSLTWNAQEQASGMYLVRAETAGSVAVQKILLLK
jgi:flagellar hook assembly protein FlgD